LKVLSSVRENAEVLSLSNSEANTFDTEKDLLLMIKGAPDVLIGRCSEYVAGDGTVKPLDDATRHSVENVKDKWSSQGKRVLLLARKVLPGSTVKSNPNNGEFEAEAESHARTNLTLIALVGIVDPPRDEIPEVISQLRVAGIRTMMVTGDFKLIAQAIARFCGIITTDDPTEIHSITDLPRTATIESQKLTLPSISESSALVISGPELASLTDHQWDILTTYPALVFARTTPIRNYASSVNSAPGAT
jgi:sodium/potassium-transporting ATPase subunit alpha